MRAVNLIPAELRRGGVGSPGRSGNAVYVVLGALAALVVLAGAYVLAGNSLNSNQSKLAAVKAQSDRATAEAAALKPYSDFAALSQSRSQTVASLAASRFDWDRAIREMARVLPASAQIIALKGTVNPSVQVESGELGPTQQLRAASTDPAIELAGCATGQTEVAQIMSRLRLVDGVRRVSLSASDKGEQNTAGTPGASAAASNGCSTNRAKFGLVMFFGPVGAPATTPGSGARTAPVPTPPTSGDVGGGASGAAGATQPVAEAKP
jgi:Tfp pilus assembly protein PilN